MLTDVLSAGDRLIVDERVAELHPWITTLGPITPSLPVVASETLKSLDGATTVLDWLLESRFDRSGTIYVVGGGTVQDVASFVASILYRGVRWVFVPTTLLAQGDSCIGSKSSINHGGYKNQLGTFFPPAHVLIDESFLTTLAPQEVRSGIGEMFHYAALGGDTVFADYERTLANGWRDLSTHDMTELAMRALEVKRAFIEEDEFDSGQRKHLNFGHTFGHGLEVASSGAIPHGVAVAYGVALANAYAAERGLLSKATQRRVEKAIGGVVDPSELRLVTAARVLDGMSRDKKRSNDELELILLEDLGKPTRLKVRLDGHLETFLHRSTERWQRDGLIGTPTLSAKARYP